MTDYQLVIIVHLIKYRWSGTNSLHLKATWTASKKGAEFSSKLDVEFSISIGYNRSRNFGRRAFIMPNIKPISDLRNYATVLETVQVGKPLYLTKNGRGCYTVLNIDEEEEQRVKAEKYDRMRAQLRLMCELSEGRRSGEEEGWISSEDVRNHFRDRANAK